MKKQKHNFFNVIGQSITLSIFSQVETSDSHNIHLYWMRLLIYEILRLGVLWRQSKLSYCHIRVSSVYRLSCRSVATGLKKSGRTSWKLQILTCWKVIIYGAPATCSDLFRALSAWVCTSFQPFIVFQIQINQFFLVREINSSIMNKWYLIKKHVHR